MDGRILIGAVLSLVLAAFGGFYFALGSHFSEIVPPPAASPPLVAANGSGAEAKAAAPAASTVAMNGPPPAPPVMVTPATVEAEFQLSEHADLLALLKQRFPSDYDQLLTQAVNRRNDGISDQAFGRQLAERFQEIMRDKLKFGAGATMPTIDRLAANEASLFHALGTEGASFCLKMLGRDDSPAAVPPPDSVRQLMELGTLYRFQAIAEGMTSTKPVEPLTKDEAKAYEASVTRAGLNPRDVNTGAYLKVSQEPGKPCLTLETLHLAIAKLPDGVRRKIYASMFFAGRG